MNRRCFLSFLVTAPLVALATPSELIELGSPEFHAARESWLYESHLVRVGGFAPAAARVIALRGFKAGSEFLEAAGGGMA